MLTFRRRDIKVRLTYHSAVVKWQCVAGLRTRRQRRQEVNEGYETPQTSSNRVEWSPLCAPSEVWGITTLALISVIEQCLVEQ